MEASVPGARVKRSACGPRRRERRPASQVHASVVGKQRGQVEAGEPAYLDTLRTALAVHHSGPSRGSLLVVLLTAKWAHALLGAQEPKQPALQ